MAEMIQVPKSKDREKIYQAIIPQIDSLLAGETDLVANQANISAVLKEAFAFLWVGFYWVKDHQLVLGAFQGPLACTRISFDKGVCGLAYRTRKTVIVSDVDKFPGHIACSSLSKSEIVVPIISRSEAVLGVLDVDSLDLDDFSEIDRDGLETITRLLALSLPENQTAT